MRKGLLSAMACCLLLSCGGAKANQEPSDYDCTDASAGKSAQVKESQSQPMADFEPGDYKIYALRGKVKEVKYEFSSVTFDEQGHVTADEDFLGIGRNGFQNTILRDKSGRIAAIDIDEEEFGTYLSYNGDGLLSECKHTTDESSYVKTISYNASYEVISEKIEYAYYYGDAGYTRTDTYTILERDSHGNWTKTSMHSIQQGEDGTKEESTNEISRAIEYYQ